MSSEEEDDQPSVGHNVNSFDISQNFEYNQDLSMAQKTSEVPLQIYEIDVSDVMPQNYSIMLQNNSITPNNRNLSDVNIKDNFDQELLENQQPMRMKTLAMNSPRNPI